MSIFIKIALGAIPVAKCLASRRAGLAERWTPRELRHTFVSLLSNNGMAIEEIIRLVGHSSSNVTETVYRHQIRPVITIGAEAMDKIFANEQFRAARYTGSCAYRWADLLRHL
jgi:integrase